MAFHDIQAPMAESERIATSNNTAAWYSDGYLNLGIKDTGRIRWTKN
jgi:hypothetical protein